MSRLKRLIVEIHKRSLWQVLGIYVVGAAVGYQLIQALTEGLGLPDWFPAFAIVLFIILLPVVLATAFVQEGVRGPRRPETLPPFVAGPDAGETPTEAAESEVAEPAVREARGVHDRVFTWRNAGLGFVIALGVWGVVATGWLLLNERAAAPATDLKFIAVLPLENLSPDPDNEFFAAGIHEDILSQLSKIGALNVISRTSVLQYSDTDKDIPTIAEELGVDGIVEGSVRRAGNQVRVVLQLIDKTDVHLWSETYDRDLTVANVFAIQSDIAQQIARALEAELTSEERERIEEIPTEDLEAYEFYLRGLEYLRRLGYLAENYRSAQRMLEQAVELDPSFALAHAWLSMIHSWIYWFRYDFTEERLRRARAAVDRALELDPDLPEAHLALADYYYYGFRAYDKALEEMAVAEQGLPGDAGLIQTRGYIYRRQGGWEEAIANLKRAATLAPRWPELILALGETHSFLRRYDEAERYYEQALAIEPEYEEAAYRRAQIGLLRDGDLEPLRAYTSAYPDAHLRRRWLEFLSRDYPAALAALSQVEDEIIEDPNLAFIHVAYDPKSLYAGLIHLAAGQGELAQAAFDSARVILEPAVSERPDDERRHQSLGVAYAGLGMNEAAVREGEKAVELMPMSRDSYFAPTYLQGLAQIHTMVGDYDAAIDQLDYLLSIPSAISVPLLQVDPLWDPLRDHPRFQELLEGNQ